MYMYMLKLESTLRGVSVRRARRGAHDGIKSDKNDRDPDVK